jgi:hypothetical protein
LRLPPGQFDVGGADGINMNFRDGNEVLHVQLVPNVAGTVLQFKGEFPRARCGNLNKNLGKMR